MPHFTRRNNPDERPPHWMPRAGDICNYHSIIGEPATHIGYEVTSVKTLDNGTPVAWLDGISGFVSCDALTPNEESNDRKKFVG